jgi:thiamine biosynthesis lipoprotein
VTRPKTVLRRARPLLGTLVSVSVASRRPSDALRAIEAAFSAGQALEALFTEFDPSSVVSRINAEAGTRPVVVPSIVFAVLAEGQRVAERTRGAFDLTWAALRPAWNLDAARFAPPSSSRLKELTASVGAGFLELDAERSTAFLNRRGAAIGLGGIAKAAIADQMAFVLRSCGEGHALVEAGGDCCARGKPSQRRWKVGIRHPRSAGIMATSLLHDEALVTSGDYERFVTHRGRRYHHILDPRTGAPARHSMSATVIAPTGALADALSTALFVLGPEGLPVVEEFPGVCAIVVDARGELRGSPGWARRFKLLATGD